MMTTIPIPIPPGYYFVPTDEELITSYLLKKSMGLPLPWNQISEKDIYGENADPWDVLNDDVHWDDHFSSDKKKIKKVTYVFTKLKSRVNGKTRIGRRTRSGTWKGQTSGKEIKKGSNLIGLSKAFTFQETNSKNKGEEEHDHWTMNEYSLAGICLTNFELKYKDYVICQISRTISSKDKENQPQPQPTITPQLQLQENPNSDEEGDQVLVDEIEKAMMILSEENQAPIDIPHQDQLLLGVSKIGKKRSAAEEEGITEEQQACKMQKTTTTGAQSDQFNFDDFFDFDIDIPPWLMQLGDMTSCASSDLDALFS